MAVQTEGAHTGEHIISEAAGSRSREYITIAASQTLENGALLGKVLTGAKTGTAAALGTNTGNGTVGSITADANAQLGDYKIVIVEPASNAGAFLVERPDGTIDGHGTVAVAYNGMVNFTLADGGTDFVAGDAFTLTVVAADATAQDEYKALDVAATDGTQIVAGVLYGAVTTGVGETAQAVAHVRDCEVNGNLIVHQSGADAAAKAVNVAALATLGIIVR